MTNTSGGVTRSGRTLCSRCRLALIEIVLGSAAIADDNSRWGTMDLLLELRTFAEPAGEERCSVCGAASEEWYANYRARQAQEVTR